MTTGHHVPGVCRRCGGATSRAANVECMSCYRSRRLEDAARLFWDQVDMSGDCWLWTGKQNQDGYGIRSAPAYRLAYEWVVGPVAPGLHLDHLCRVKLCVRPSHLEPVTAAENTRRMAPFLRKTHCRKGHLMPEVTGQRKCLVCQRVRHTIYMRGYNARRRAAA